MRHRWITVGVTVAAFALALFGMKFVQQQFFPDSSRPEILASWSQAGSTCSFEPLAYFYAALPQEEWPEDEAERAEIRRDWDPQLGDRRQELVLIGIDMDIPALRQRLERCLLSDAEMAAGEAGWRVLPDPFPAWEL